MNKLKGRGGYDHFLKVAKKKKEIQSQLELVSNATSQQQVEQMINVPQWMVKHFVYHWKLTNLNLKTPQESALQMMANMTINCKVFDVYKYNGDTMNVGKFIYDINNGDLIAMIENDVKVNSTVLKIDKQQLSHLIGRSEYVGSMNIFQYNQLLQDWLMQKHFSYMAEKDNQQRIEDIEAKYTIDALLSGALGSIRHH